MTGLTKRTKTADIQCVLLASCGFSYKLIQSRTGLSRSQIALRIKQTGSYINHYRNGETPLARHVADTVSDDVLAQLKEVKQQLLAAVNGHGT